jgi:hypothetical protein
LRCFSNFETGIRPSVPIQNTYLTFENSEGITTGSLRAATETERERGCLLTAGARRAGMRAAAADLADEEVARAVCIVSEEN